MPVYEFLCRSCQKKSSFFVKSFNQPLSPVCSSCGGTDLSRVFSSFAHHKSMADIHAESGSPENASPDFYRDPRNIGRWTENKFQQMGMEMPSQIRDMIDAARDGEMPAPVKDLQPGVTEV